MNNSGSKRTGKPVNKSVPHKNKSKKKLSHKFAKFVGGLFFFALFYIIMILLSVLLLFLSVSCRHKDPGASQADITVVSYETDQKGALKQVENQINTPIKETVGESTGAYLPVSAFKMLGADITPAGDPLKSITVNLDSVGESASFMVNSDKANVNGTDITLDNKTVIRDGELFIPMDFFENHVFGISVTLKDNKYTVKKTGFEELSFVNKPADPTPLIVESDYFTDEPIKFKSDLSKYEQYMNPENRDEYLYLVNVSNLLSEDFVPEDLRNVQYTKPDRAKQQMSLNAQMAVDAMLKEAREYGFDNLWVTSAYRSYETQSWLFDNEIEAMREEYGDEFAEEKAKESVNPPGASEHQTGLTADIHTLSSASLKFAGTPAAVWLEENAQYFGFILRYPEDKTEITGIMYEPWHFRFVGRYHAMRITELGMCLEEYMKYLENF